MKKEIADQWVAALRSGKYKQGKDGLQNFRENSFCCLGVLCELVRKDMDISVYPSLHGDFVWYDGNFGGLSLAIQRKTGVNSPSGTLEGKGTSLMTLNDSGVSFEEIADIIEANWEQL